MAFETEDAKSTLILYRTSNGKYRYSGLVRMTDSTGVTRIRVSNQNITPCLFDDLEIQDPPSSEENSDVGLTHFHPDWSDTTII